MINIRPVTDLQNKFTEIETIVNDGQPVFLTKNGYGSMVAMSIGYYSLLANDTERKLIEASEEAASSDVRLTHEEVFGNIRWKCGGLFTAAGI
ncbi:MAG: type II toxin-antitoxin system prevent-host-death family antitoxin [Oscillospiraceae bacterium]|nr:type II toxin-antitoxin system prevent-host-death family antitoxin [Oscillospiraceae bacterium]